MPFGLTRFAGFGFGSRFRFFPYYAPWLLVAFPITALPISFFALVLRLYYAIPLVGLYIPLVWTLWFAVSVVGSRLLFPAFPFTLPTFHPIYYLLPTRRLPVVTPLTCGLPLRLPLTGETLLPIIHTRLFPLVCLTCGSPLLYPVVIPFSSLTFGSVLV